MQPSQISLPKRNVTVRPVQDGGITFFEGEEAELIGMVADIFIPKPETYLETTYDRNKLTIKTDFSATSEPIAVYLITRKEN